jgi:thiol-disulfide isomerase/thioredoxin
LTDGDEGEVYDIRNKRAQFFNEFGFKSIYDGGDIIFDPSLYHKGFVESESDILNDPLQSEFNHLLGTMGNMESNFRELIPKLRNATVDQRQAVYDSLDAEINNLKNEVSPIFRQMVLEKQLSFIRYNHPVYGVYREVWKEGKIDSVALKKFAESNEFKDYLSTTKGLIDEIDPKSYLLNGDFIGNVLTLDMFVQKVRAINQALDFPKDYPYDFTLNFIKTCSDKDLCSGILYRVADHYAEADDPEKATYLINLLKNDYADEFYVGEGHADRILARLQIQPGVPAPGFAVKSVAGDSLNLLDFKGKFVFIDFWGSWCGPCIGELPNLKKLAKALPADQLQIIGLVEDDSTRFIDYLNKNPLPYPNALAGKTVLDQYGINRFPTTFLIDPDGNILAMDLRGENLVTLVKEKMSEYQM